MKQASQRKAQRTPATVLIKDQFSLRCCRRPVRIGFWAERLNLQILPVLLAMSALTGQAYGREARKAMRPPQAPASLSLSQVIAVVLEHNPMIQSARAKWMASRERIPQAGAWEDLKVGTNIVLGRFVSVPANALTDQMLSVEQMLRNQLEKIETLHHHIELYRDNLLPTARQTVASYEADYETDKATLLILLTSQRNLRELETMYYQDLSDYRVSLAELESVVGLDLKTSATGKSNAMGKMR